MSPNVPVFDWTAQKETAAQLLAEDELPDHEIAARVGVDRRSLTRWKKHPAFQAKIKAVVDALAAAGHKRAIGRRERRVRALDERWRAMQQVIAERAADPDHAKAPGGTTGLLVRTVKSIGAGENAEQVEEFAVDTGLLKELREHEKQAAQEVGQWIDKKEHTGKDGAPLIPRVATELLDDLRKLPVEELLRQHRESLGLENGA